LTAKDPESLVTKDLALHPKAFFKAVYLEEDKSICKPFCKVNHCYWLQPVALSFDFLNKHILHTAIVPLPDYHILQFKIK
jgi:hypothetical protein